MRRVTYSCTLVTVLAYVSIGTLALAGPATGQTRQQDKVTTGMQRAAAQEILAKYGLESKEEYQLSIESSRKNELLDFSPLDRGIVLIVAYDAGTEEVTRLSLFIQPEGALKHQSVGLKVGSIVFHSDGTYRLEVIRHLPRNAEK